MCWVTEAEFEVRKLRQRKRSHWKVLDTMAKDFKHWARKGKLMNWRGMRLQVTRLEKMSDWARLLGGRKNERGTMKRKAIGQIRRFMRSSCWGKNRIFSASQHNELGIYKISRHQATEMHQHFCRYFWCFHCLSCTQVQVTLSENLFKVPVGSSHLRNSCPWDLQNHTGWLL